MTNESYSLLWIIDNNLAELLDRATWLETSAELCNLGWQVTLVSPGFPNGDLDVRITTVRVPSPELYLVGRLIFQFLITLRIVFLSRDADIVLFHQYSGPFVLPQVLLRKILRRSRPVFIMDSRTAPMDTTSIRGRLWMLYLEISRKMANRLADGQTSITQRLARLQGMPDAKLMGVWPSGVKLDRFKQASSLRCWPSEKDPLRLIYIGVLARERNLSALIEAVLKVRSDGDKVELYLVGDGVQRTEIEEIVRKNNDGAIKLFPPVPPVEIPRILASAHVGVLPFPDLPKFQVSSPIKLFEYMASGMALLATQIACHTEVIGNGDYVIWARDSNVSGLASAIHEACIQKAKLSSMGAKAEQAAKNWTWKNSAKKLDCALRKVLLDVY